MAAPFQLSSFFNLQGRIVAITGATGGIGSAIASRFAREGARLLLIGRDQFKLADELASQQAQIKAWRDQDLSSNKNQTQQTIIQPPEAHRVGLIRNLLNASEWRKIVSQPDTEIDVLINCAGVSQASLLPRTVEGDISRIVSTNLVGTMIGTKIVTTDMIKRRNRARGADPATTTLAPFTGGCVVNVSSLLGQLGLPGTSVYAATKAGLVGFTKSLAVELAPYIRVNAILPGFINTPMTQDMQNPEGETSQNPILDAIPMRRLGTPEEVADAVLFLTKNQYATGCILNLDGGLGSAVARGGSSGSQSSV